MGKKTLKRIVFDQYQMEKYEKIEFWHEQLTAMKISYSEEWNLFLTKSNSE
jgi:hypothetical protein